MEPTPQGEQTAPAVPETLPQISTPTIEQPTQSPSFSLKKKIIIGSGALLGGIILLFVILFAIGSTVGKDSRTIKEKQSTNTTANTTTMETKTITLSEFFPLISGNIADYDVNIPKDYVAQYISINDKDLGTSALANSSLIGLQNDVDNILSQVKENNKADFKTISRAVLRAEFTANTGLDDKGNFVDRTGGPIDSAMFQGMGMTNVVYTKSSFRGIKAAPIDLLTAEYNGSHVRMMHMYSPVDNLVILFTLQGGSDQTENDTIWNNFTESFTKPL